jgi:hypothetical protein
MRVPKCGRWRIWAVDSVDILRRIFSAPDTSFRESQFCRIIKGRVLNRRISTIVLVPRANDSNGGRATAKFRGLFPLLNRRSRFSCSSIGMNGLKYKRTGPYAERLSVWAE